MTDTKVKLVLASASPRRLALLEQAGVVPDLLNPVDIDETPKKRETPRSLSARLAVEKARTAAASPLVDALGPLRFIVAADTVTVIAGPPTDRQCSPERVRGDTDLLEALAEVTNWRRQGDLVVLVGPRSLRFRLPTN